MSTGLSIFQKKLSRNDWIIIISNLLPVYGVWFLGWSSAEVFIVYALETLIVGMMTVLKLLIATIAKNPETGSINSGLARAGGLFFIVFFILHFGIFAFVQTSIFSSVAGINPPGKGSEYFFFHWWEFINTDIGILLGIFLLSYLLRDLMPFLINKAYQEQSLIWIMLQPYGRIIIQQFTVILGSMFLLFHFGKLFILIFALIKIFAEVYFSLEKMLRKNYEVKEEDLGK